MDRLAEVLDIAHPVLRRVDEVLATAGAPAEHDVWAELRRVRLLPGDAANAVAALRPAAFAEAGPALRADAAVCADTAAGLPPPGPWSGEAADAYDDLRRRVAADLSGDADSLDERLAATADLAEALAGWMARSRADLAGALADVLASDAAVALAGGADSPPSYTQAMAAAEIAARILRTVADGYEFAADVLHQSAGLATAIRP